MACSSVSRSSAGMLGRGQKDDVAHRANITPSAEIARHPARDGHLRGPKDRSARCVELHAASVWTFVPRSGSGAPPRAPPPSSARRGLHKVRKCGAKRAMLAGLTPPARAVRPRILPRGGPSAQPIDQTGDAGRGQPVRCRTHRRSSVESAPEIEGLGLRGSGLLGGQGGVEEDHAPVLWARPAIGARRALGVGCGGAWEESRSFRSTERIVLTGVRGRHSFVRWNEIIVPARGRPGHRWGLAGPMVGLALRKLGIGSRSSTTGRKGASAVEGAWLTVAVTGSTRSARSGSRTR
jgi:hypothetical protein